MLVFSYKGKQGQRTMKNIKRGINEVLRGDKKMQLVYTGTKFNVTDKQKEHNHNLTTVKCSKENCL